MVGDSHQRLGRSREALETAVVGDNSNQLFNAVTGWTADTGQIQIKGDNYGGQYADEGTQFADLD